MATERDIVFKLSIDTSRFTKAMADAAAALRRMFGGPDDLSRRWPTCSVNHEDYFTGRGAYLVDKTASDELWTCPGCGAAL